MRVIVFVKATATSEAGAIAEESEFAEMGTFNEALAKAGVLLAGEGLEASSKAKRIVFGPSGTRVVDGPFASPTELVAGFWIWKVKDMDEAVVWARKCPNPMRGQESVLEIRRIFEFEDFGAEMSQELREREQRLRTAVVRLREQAALEE